MEGIVLPGSRAVIYTDQRLSKQLHLFSEVVELVTLRILEIECKLDKLEISVDNYKRTAN